MKHGLKRHNFGGSKVGVKLRDRTSEKNGFLNDVERPVQTRMSPSLFRLRISGFNFGNSTFFKFHQVPKFSLNWKKSPVFSVYFLERFTSMTSTSQIWVPSPWFSTKSIIWNKEIPELTKEKKFKAALELYDKMKEQKDIQPSQITYASLF